MRYLVASMLVATGISLYLSTAKNTASVLNLGQAVKAGTEDSRQPDQDPAGDAEPEERMVQIHGKWYKHRADNTYVIDGVPTLYIAKKHELKPKAEAAAPATAATANVNYQKSQRLAKMAGENPLAVYTPDGMQALRDGIEAAQNGAAERKKALEALTKEP